MINFTTIFNNCDFNNLSLQNYQEKIINNLPNDLNFKYHISRFKLLINIIDSEYMIKIFLSDTPIIKNVQQLYNKASLVGLETFFAPYISQSCSKNVFLQPKVIVAQDYAPLLNREINHLATIQQLLNDTLLKKAHYKMVEYYPVYYKWLDCFFDTQTYETIKKFLNFIIDNYVIDIFAPENYGLLNNIPIIFDYDECFRYDIQEQKSFTHRPIKL